MDHDQADGKTTPSEPVQDDASRTTKTTCVFPRGPNEKLRALGLAWATHNVSRTSSTLHLSRATLYRWMEQFKAQGLAGLLERDLHRPHPHRRVDAVVERIILELARQRPLLSAPGVVRELGRRGYAISVGGVRCVWARLGLETRRKRAMASQQAAR
ncbi:MAG: helix-turn-helix domain-containing protein [bacterium]